MESTTGSQQYALGLLSFLKGDQVMNASKPVFVLLASLGLVGCATSGSGSSSGAATGGQVYNDCFFARSMTDWRALDNRNLLIYAQGRRPYLVRLATPSMNLRFVENIGLVDRNGRICPYGGDAVLIRGGMPERIPIMSIRRLTDEQLLEVFVEFGIKPPEVVPAPEVDVEE
jgi:hypothetical protein